MNMQTNLQAELAQPRLLVASVPSLLKSIRRHTIRRVGPSKLLLRILPRKMERHGSKTATLQTKAEQGADLCRKLGEGCWASRIGQLSAVKRVCCSSTKTS
jgi:hypothetical protein